MVWENMFDVLKCVGIDKKSLAIVKICKLPDSGGTGDSVDYYDKVVLAVILRIRGLRGAIITTILY